MPHKYEREIEEILKNMQRNEPEPGVRERSRGFPRPAGGSSLRLGLSASELLFLLGIAFALAGVCAMWFDGARRIWSAASWVWWGSSCSSLG